MCGQSKLSFNKHGLSHPWESCILVITRRERQCSRRRKTEAQFLAKLYCLVDIIMITHRQFWWMKVNIRKSDRASTCVWQHSCWVTPGPAPECYHLALSIFCLAINLLFLLSSVWEFPKGTKTMQNLVRRKPRNLWFLLNRVFAFGIFPWRPSQDVLRIWTSAC